jgi:lipopolysaccharide biosynthesis glycosyltransferase
MQNYVVFQAYGTTAIFQEAIYAILSLHRFEADRNYQIVIYTDNKAVFQQYLHKIPIIYEPINTNLIKEWRGEKNFVHRFKIKMLQDFFSKYQGNLLYVDTDIVFRQSISSIFTAIAEGQFFMHLAEGQIDQQKGSLSKKITRFLRNNQFVLSAEQTLQISAATVMWNAGVIGMNSKQKALVDTVLLLTDAMYAKYQKHIMEQLAFSYCLQNYAEVKPTDKLIYHYWFFKEFRMVLENFFEVNEQKTIEQVIAEIDKINPEVLVIPKKNYEAMPKWRRWWWKIRGKTWKMPEVSQN